MSVSGFVFFVTSNYIALIISVFIGTISVTGTEIGAFLTIEQAMLPQTIDDPKKRNTVYALYTMAGTFAMYAGVLLSGLPQNLVQQYGFNQIESIKPLFALYSIIGLGVLGIYFLISNKVEISRNNNNNSNNNAINTSPTFKPTLSPKSRRARHERN